MNRLLRLGLERERDLERSTPASRFQVEPFDVGEVLVDIDDVTAALEVGQEPLR